MKRRFKILGSIAVAMLFLLNIVQINAQEKETIPINEKEVESFSLLDETEFNYEEKLISEGRIKYDIISPYEFISLDKLPSSDEMYAIAFKQYPELIDMNEDSYYLNFISGSSKKQARTTQAEMLQPNPYGSTSFNITGGSSIKVWKAPSSISFSNVIGSVSGLTFATYDGKIAYCIEPGTYHGGGTLSSDPLSVFTNYEQNHQVSRWARSAEYYQSVDPNYWGEYLGVAQDKIWNVMGSNNNGSTISSTYYDRAIDYKNALDNPNVVTTNLPLQMYVGQNYEITVQYGKVYNHIQKLSNNFDIKLSSNSINSNKLDLRAVYTITPKSHGSFDIRFLSEPSGTRFSANYIYGSNQNLFVGRALDPNMKQFNSQIIGEVEVGAIKVDSQNQPVANVEIEFSTTEDFSSNVQKATTDENGKTVPMKFQLESGKTEIEVYAREVSVPSHFILDTSIISKVIKAGEIGTFEFVNDYRTIIIEKVDEDTKDSLQNTKIEFWEKVTVVPRLGIDDKYVTLENGDVIKYIFTDVTNSDGKVTLNTHNIHFDRTYYIREIEATEGYVIKSDFIKLENPTKDKHFYYVLENEKIKNEVTLGKVDEDGNNLAGAELVIKDEQGNIIEEWVSEEEPQVLVLEYGIYYYCETETIAGYVLNEECEKIIVSEDGIEQYFEIINKKIKNEVTLGKIDEDGKNLAGAELIVKDEDGNIIFEWVSTDKSKTVILDYGNYTYCETKAPNTYELNTECKEIIVDTQGEVQYKEIINYKKEDTLVSTGFANTYLVISFAVLFVSVSLYLALGKRNEKKEEV